MALSSDWGDLSSVSAKLKKLEHMELSVTPQDDFPPGFWLVSSTVTSPHPTEPSGLLRPQGNSACKGQTLLPYHLPNTLLGFHLLLNVMAIKN